MVANHHFTRLDALELKEMIYQKIGRQRAEKYFYQLRRLFSAQISKDSFDKLCILTIGRENLSLHNRLIRSILKNSCLAKVPPRILKKADGSLSIKVSNGYQRSCLQSLYGDSFPQSPRKCRSPVYRDRKNRDRPSPLGPLGQSPNVTFEEGGALRVQEQQSATELLSLGSRPPVEVVSVEDGEEVEQVAASPSIQSRSPVTAPFGIPMNFGSARQALRSVCMSADCIGPLTCQNSGELPDTRSLRSLLEKRLEQEGLSVSLECANLLNNGLDAFLKRLIGPCVEIARLQSGKGHARCARMLDLHVAVQPNPCILGENWPLQLEKICSRTFED